MDPGGKGKAVVRGDGHDPLDAKYVDEAVEATFRDMDLGVSTTGVLRDLLSRDSNSIVASSYFDDYNARGLARSTLRVRRAKVFIDYVLTDDQTSILMDYSPEFELIFRNIDLHDHSMAAAMRKIDHAIINTRVPAVAKVCDVGGDFLFHIRQGNVNVHCCNPEADVKDSARSVMRKMAVRKLIEEYEVQPREVKSMLDSYSSRDGVNFCANKAQSCNNKADVVTSVHVYDIPLSDWPEIMIKKNAKLVEGAMIFSDEFFKQSSGELNRSGVRYEINVDRDEFRMGFVGSPSWWYHHKWSELMRYGIDQRIVYGNHVYSYKIVERRADTIYFRIIAVPLSPREFLDRINTKLYCYPSVRMVEINGFDFSSDVGKGTRDKLSRRTMQIAVPLWENLVNTAAMEYERNSLDFTKMFNAYRTAAPRHTINGVLISGGYSVDVDLMKIVVIHAAVAGATRAITAEKACRALTAAAFTQRASLAQSTGKKLLHFVLDTVKTAALLPVYLTGVSWLAKYLTRKVYDFASMSLMAEMYEPEFKTVTCDKIFLKQKKSDNVPLELTTGPSYSSLAGTSIIHDLLLGVSTNLELAETFLNDFGPQLNDEQRNRLERSIELLKVSFEPCTEKDKPVKSGIDNNLTHTQKQAEGFHAIPESSVNAVSLERLDAIREAITEVKLEQRVTHSICKRMYSNIVVGGKAINYAALTRNKEADGNPDLWRIANGVLMNHSVSGIPTRDFCHMRLYLGPMHPQPFARVVKSTWYNERKDIHEVNYLLEDSEFSGFGLTCDPLLIYNGEDVINTLESSLKLDHSKYIVDLQEGPPGCGKTYSIVQSYQETDMVLCPVKLSIEDTKLRLQEKFGDVIKSRDCARTVDSLLIHGTRSPIQYSRILADECFMTHSGKWYACAAILGVKKIQAYGDTKQIPHIPRVQCSNKYVSLKYDTRTINPISRRCPADSVVTWSQFYDVPISTTNAITSSIKETDNFVGLSISKFTCLMGMYQSDKKEIRRLFPNHESSAGKHMIVTTHESEGKTYKEVILFRFDRRIRKDNMSLYDKEPYAIVALSRHTHKFTYVRANGLGDLISRLITKTQNPRLIKEALHKDAKMPDG